jgi:probable rRNA maturation factor
MAIGNSSIYIQFATPAIQDKWGPLLTLARLKKWVNAACKVNYELTLRLVNSKEAYALNHNFRGGDHATNILTFSLNHPSDDLQQGICADLIFCMPVIVKEAKLQGKDIVNHFTHLLIHGVLHAQGYDHEDYVEAEAMEALEVAILQQLKLPNPYI